MPPPRQNPETLSPSDRVRIGAFTIDLALREISAANGVGAPVRITVKAQGVLLALIARAGKVVAREDLLDEVWPDTMPGDDVVTQAVIQLRKAFGDSRKQTAYIETISKRGYRLIAEVEWLPAREAVAPAWPEASEERAAVVLPIADEHDDPPPPARWRHRFVPVLGLTVLGLALALWGFYRLNLGISRTDDDRAQTSAAARTFASVEDFQRIASLPEYERAPSLSPDGAMVVYAKASKDESTITLMVQTASPLPPKALTESVPGRYDTRPAWSPDGLRIAFVRIEADRCKIMLISATGGSERELGPCIGNRPAMLHWYPDGQALIAAAQPPSETSNQPEASMLFRMQLQTGRWEPLAYDRAPSDFDQDPSVSPDGRWIAFHRNLAQGDLWRIPVAGGPAQRLTRLRTDMAGLTWMHDGRSIVFARESEGRWILSRLELASGALSDFSVPGAHAAYPSAASRNGAITFQIVDSREVILRLSTRLGEHAFSQAETIAATSRINRTPALSPDRAQLMFASDRSGRPLLWWMRLSEPDSLRPIEGFTPKLGYPPDWDAASKSALAIGVGAKGRGIYRIEPNSGHADFLGAPQDDSLQVLHHPDSDKLLVVGSDVQGRTSLILYDLRTRPWMTLARLDDVIVAAVDRSARRILFARRMRPQILETDLMMRSERIALHLHSLPRNRIMSTAANGAWVMDVRPDCDWYWARIPEADAEHDENGICLGKEPPMRLDPVPGYDPVRGEIYLSPEDYYSYDIGYLSPPVSRRH